MRFFTSLIILFTIALLGSCAPKQIALSKSTYHAQDKVAIIIHKPTAFVGKSGSQGLLDMAMTPQTKYKKGIETLRETYDSFVYESLKAECEKIYNSTGKKYIILDSIAQLPTIEINKKQVINHLYIKDTYQVEQVQEITCTYGITIGYYGFIETDKNTFITINSIITDLENRTKLQQYNQTQTIKLKGKWRDNNYTILRNSLESSIKLGLKDFNSQF